MNSESPASPLPASPKVVRGQTSPFPSTPTTASVVHFLEPPPGQSYAEFIRTWSDDHVAQWLSDTKCSSLASTFKANDIRGDILLDLDQVVLKEMGVSSIGDRLRILNAVKTLRQRVAARSTATPTSKIAFAADDENPQPFALGRVPSRRLESGRPAPLQLSSSAKANLPHLVRDPGPDSARLANFPGGTVRPLPGAPHQPPNSAAALNTPSSSTSSRQIPPLPPVPKGHPPPLPPARPSARSALSSTPSASGHRTPEPPTPSLLTPSSANWAGSYHLPSDPRPPNAAKASPALQAPRSRGGAPAASSNPSHARSGSAGVPSPARALHPYAGTSPPQHHNLSPIVEAFGNPPPSASSATPPSASYAVGRGPFQPITPSATPTHSNVPSLDDLRRKHVKFLLPADEVRSSSVTIDVSNCSGGVEVLEKVLKKVGKLLPRTETSIAHTSAGGLILDSWAIVLDFSDEPSQAEPLSEAEIMSICLAPPDHPARERGLTLRQVRRYPPPAMNNKASKRASTISVLSGLGVTDFEPPSSPTVPTSPPRSPNSTTSSKKGKLRNFFGQRPPSELITTHLAEYFPFTEKKVLERTARHSMMRFRRESTLNPPQVSRFSSSTIGSQSRASMNASPRNSLSPSIAPSTRSEDIPPIPVPREEDVPQVSLSQEDGSAIDLNNHTQPGLTPSGHLLPPIPFPTDSLSDSLQDFASSDNAENRRLSRAQRPLSTMSKRTSFMTELRSKRDRSDTASLVTVDEITANVESRRDSSDRTDEGSSSISGTEETTLLDEDEESPEDESLLNEDVPEDAAEDEDDEEPREERKWIKGALIGAGSFGKVYLGMDAASGFLMAVKQVELPSGSAPNEARKKSMLSALEREIELLQDLQHENIVQYFYSSMDEEFLNIFLEYVPGGSVTALLRNYGAFEEPLVKNFVRQILEGLNYLHERDIIHRDIKGANILVDNKGGVKISDFGISKKVEDNLLGGGNRAHRPSLQGSVFWMAPEVVKQSGHTKKADIWSVGCLVVEMLTGDHPWGNLNQMQAIFKIGSSAKPEIPSDISPDAQSFLAQTFELDQNARPDAAELLQHKWLAVPKKPVFPSSKAKAIEVAA